MATILIEIETVFNVRSLNFIYDEHYEPRPLTPMHFIKMGQNQQTYPVTFAQIIENGCIRSSLLKRERYQMLLLNWAERKQQYLLDLRTAHCMKNSNLHAGLQIGNVVLIEGGTIYLLLVLGNQMKKLDFLQRLIINYLHTCTISPKKKKKKNETPLFFSLQIIVQK